MSKDNLKDVSENVENADDVLVSVMKLLVAAVCKRGGKLTDLCRLVTVEGESIVEEIVNLIVVEVTNFIVSSRFKIDISSESLVKISAIDDNFKGWFGDKIEEIKKETIPRFHKDLMCASLYQYLIKDFGGEDKVKVSLFGIYELMKIQKNGESGVLLTNGYSNIFYVCDNKEILRAVVVEWGGNGWYIYARSVNSKKMLFAGDRVFYC
ncbi:MAG: hypothetical protein COU29_01290 [Candidatus Magasanikbacteria bacterium CG10_big_fil_rev_8_21_14_0_10_36_32]|uniref:Uncharacterized protein n=1 Tax=Candidatus Magasanikbacteria bacterium CG10_big_fil_rev_8_21_14_0_10_36_32 TaxID=1974646 RepID=A0A2M6W6N7_9BACT|nr:MAG: hypothetical protein COU29_01290 [Candidatus Magasanikbacteria bacterium CG10_big_fil_rev_8_21_14_0_10_36_32]